MNREKKLKVLKCIAYVIVCSLFLIVISISVSRIKGYSLNNVLFGEGILVLIISLIFGAGVGATGLYFNSRNSSNSQFTVIDNEGVTKFERDMKSIKKPFSITIFKISLIIASFLICCLSFLI
ncbi:hypothetical protein ACQPU1_17425 [Clostridium paraputrificum]|uniref:hypothetical protein n=1 Tax=Clostridium paraputrificum TaxID=29363 RepID=UPI003D32805F